MHVCCATSSCCHSKIKHIAATHLQHRHRPAAAAAADLQGPLLLLLLLVLSLQLLVGLLTVALA
jgi:hypothetical protein